METVQEKVVKDVSSLHWFLKRNLFKDEEYVKYQTNIHKGMTYLGDLFNQCNSVTTIDLESSCFIKYAIFENSKLLRLTYKWGQNINNEDLTVLTQELFSNSNDFIIRRIEESDGREKVQIIDATGKNICMDKEYLSRYGQREFPNNSRLVDILRIITLEDVHNVVMDIIEEEKETSEKEETAQQKKKTKIPPTKNNNR